ncbi:MAG: acyloxyacyl hydrolase [Nitrosomonadales bacterium]|nr:acyloxyacyl hydrolase [Nitrosomonadales bacterium]
MRFGDRKEFDLSYRFQHLSNGSIKTPNPGITLAKFALATIFETT